MSAEKHPIEKMQDMLGVTMFDRITIKKEESEHQTTYRGHICFVVNHRAANYAHARAQFGYEDEIKLHIKRAILDSIYGPLRDTLYELYVEVARNTRDIHAPRGC